MYLNVKVVTRILFPTEITYISNAIRQCLWNKLLKPLAHSVHSHCRQWAASASTGFGQSAYDLGLHGSSLKSVSGNFLGYWTQKLQSTDMFLEYAHLTFSVHRHRTL
jgi:hypothetical protein